jgi:hypothetical protein
VEPKTKPALKNTRSRSPLPNVFARIQKILIDHGAREFTFELDGEGKYTALKFAFEVQGRVLHFRMPANVDKVRKALMDRAKTQTQVNIAIKQSYQVAWANVRDWLDVQMALVEIHLAELPQIFLPYMLAQDGKTTYFESLKEQHYLLPEPGVVHISEVD